jgi:hypothetical protein
MIFRLGEKWKWSHATYGQPSVITTHLASADPSLADFIGMVAHEQKHENDYFDVIWQGQGYIKTGDTDSGGIGDWIRDEWEKTAGRWKATYDYTDDRGGWGDDSKTEQFYFETDVTNFAWSDVRADDAAKRAVDANPEINQEDWSDLKVRPLQYEYKSTTGSPNPKRFVFRTTETCRNNKNFKPEEVQP